MITDEIKVIDVDTHVTEPVDIWTSRVSKKWGDKVPHVREHPESGNPVWFLNDKPSAGVAATTYAGWKKWPPESPPTLEDTDPASWDSSKRLERMDEYGIFAQVIYPNVAGFGSQNFLRLEDPDLMIECVQAYNDFLTDWCAVDPNRLLPISAMPFWNVEQCVAEIERTAKLGHKGVLFTGKPDRYGAEPLAHPQWEPVWSACEEYEQTLNFHIGSGGIDGLIGFPGNGYHANYAKGTVQLFLNNNDAVMEVISSGICHRHPKLNVVSVESGIGWIPFLLEAFDWQWLNSGVRDEHPEYDLLPSEYFKRQIFACFWFEQQSAIDAIRSVGADSFLYETDFPHPTSMSPGPKSYAEKPKDFIEQTFSVLTEEERVKVLRDNAARLYHVDVS